MNDLAEKWKIPAEVRRTMTRFRFLDDLRKMLGTAYPGENFDNTSFDEGIEIVVRWSLAEIIKDVDEGIVPASVPDFSSLHDYVDANLYGGADHWPNLPSETDDEQYQNEFCRFWNAARDKVDVWIKAGGIQARKP